MRGDLISGLPALLGGSFLLTGHITGRHIALPLSCRRSQLACLDRTPQPKGKGRRPTGSPSAGVTTGQHAASGDRAS